MPTQRRSRIKRSSKGKRLALTARDLAIFEVLANYRYLNSAYLHAFVGGASETRFKERLGDLFHEGFIDRPEKQWEFAEARYQPSVYELGSGGRRVLSEGGRLSSPRTYLSRQAQRQFHHSTMICGALASVELAARAKAGLRFIPWGEILVRAPARERVAPFCLTTAQVTIVPDALFGLEYANGDKKGYRFFALEADRGTMPVVRSNMAQTSVLAKLERYQEIIGAQAHRSQLGIPNLLVLIVTMSESRMSELLRVAVEHLREPASFLFEGAASADLKFPRTQLISKPWCRAGFEPLHIDR